MKKLTTLLFAIILTSATYAQVAINSNGNAANSSAMLDISSTSKGLLISSMSSSQRGNITSPANGLEFLRELTPVAKLTYLLKK